MQRIEPSSVPSDCLLNRYCDGTNYVDCYTTTVVGRISLEEFIRAFYTTWLFKVERWILHLAARPSTDVDAVRLARGETDVFAAWRVEARDADQILMCDFLGNTRSWLMIEAVTQGTRLYFGSAVVARETDTEGRRVLSRGFRMLLGFHQRYSVALLQAAFNTLTRSSR